MFVEARSINSAEGGLLERECELSDDDNEMLQSMWNNMTTGDRLVLKYRGRRSDDEAAFCPYTTDTIRLGPDIFPREWSNVTCGGTPDPSQALCGTTSLPGADPSTCQPIHYNVKVLTLTTAKLQTSKCVIETHSVTYIQLVVGCRCMA